MSRKHYCEYMKLNRSTLSYKSKGESDENLYIMERMDWYYREHHTAGLEAMVNMLALLGMVVNAKRVRRLLRKKDIGAIYPKKSLSKGGVAKYVHPYLLRGLEITRSNQVWSTDISYIPMKGGFMYLYAIIDVYSRYIVGWRLSNTLSTRNCYELLEESIALYGAPEIVNSDQGSQYTTQAWVDLVEKYQVKISMDGRGRCKDNIWIERFRRSLKQEYVYLNPTDDVDELRHGIRDYIDFYNYRLPHQSLDVLVPAMKYGIVA